MMSIGQRIKECRELLKMTQESLANKIGTTKQTIYKYENDIITNIPPDKVELLAKALAISPAYLMGWIDNDAEKGGRMKETIKNVSTKELVNELVTREGVEMKCAEPHKDLDVNVNGPAIVLIVTD